MCTFEVRVVGLVTRGVRINSCRRVDLWYAVGGATVSAGDLSRHRRFEQAQTAMLPQSCDQHRVCAVVSKCGGASHMNVHGFAFNGGASELVRAVDDDRVVVDEGAYSQLVCMCSDMCSHEPSTNQAAHFGQARMRLSVSNHGLCMHLQKNEQQSSDLQLCVTA